MKLPSIDREISSFKENRLPIGIDEAGRGPLAGPVVAGAAFVEKKFLESDFPEKKLIRDSKTLSHKQRGKIYDLLLQQKGILVGIGEVSVSTIDRINILNASLLAMRIAGENLCEKLFREKKLERKNLAFRLELLVDGNKEVPGFNCKQNHFPQGDSSIFSIAVASICAKVYRDKIMKKLDNQYDNYGFDRHNGYGTKEHLQNLKKFGPCPAHRKSFAPIKKLIRSNEN
jgi:ribonuclease HII